MFLNLQHLTNIFYVIRPMILILEHSGKNQFAFKSAHYFII